MIDRMSEISKQIEDLRNLSDGYIIGGHKNIGNKLKKAADTIDVLSAKLTAENMELESLYESGVGEGDCEYLEESALEKIIAKLEEIKNPIYREDGSLMSQKSFIRIDTVIEIVKQFIR